MEDKYYVSSDGTISKIKDLETTHLINSIAKKQREIFNAENQDDFNIKLNEIKNLKEEYSLRLNKFSETLGDSNGI